MMRSIGSSLSMSTCPARKSPLHGLPLHFGHPCAMRSSDSVRPPGRARRKFAALRTSVITACVGRPMIFEPLKFTHHAHRDLRKNRAWSRKNCSRHPALGTGRHHSESYFRRRKPHLKTRRLTTRLKSCLPLSSFRLAGFPAGVLRNLQVPNADAQCRLPSKRKDME